MAVLLLTLTFLEMKRKETEGIPEKAKNGYAGSSISIGLILQSNNRWQGECGEVLNHSNLR